MKNLLYAVLFIEGDYIPQGGDFTALKDAIRHQAEKGSRYEQKNRHIHKAPICSARH